MTVELTERQMEQIAESVASHLAEKMCTDGTACPLGLTVSNARAVQLTLKWMFLAGATFAVALITAFASGMAWVMWAGVKAALGR